MNKNLREEIREVIVAFKYGEIGCKETLDMIGEAIDEDRKRLRYIRSKKEKRA